MSTEPTEDFGEAVAEPILPWTTQIQTVITDLFNLAKVPGVNQIEQDCLNSLATRLCRTLDARHAEPKQAREKWIVNENHNDGLAAIFYGNNQVSDWCFSGKMLQIICDHHNLTPPATEGKEI